MLSNQEIIYIVYYVVERVLSLIAMGSYGAATFGVLLGFIINLGIIHLLVKYNFKQLANIVLVVGILFSVISQILCFKDLTSCNLREGKDKKKNILKNDKNRHLNKDSKWSPYSNELSGNSLGSSIKYNN